ncbi:hypothetical protein LTR74_017698 [Friedmanniomyces endolithicus]|nr:hypothetical protein LTR74_017698 [Friedmanniomyces endolithicus]
MLSNLENKPGISLSEGAPRDPTREQKSHLHNSHHIEPSTGKKRRRKADEEASEQSQEPCRKRNKEGFERGQHQDSNCHKEGAEEEDPIQCWARIGEWPKAFSQMSKPERDGSNKRRRSSTRSYSSRARDGSAPPVHSAAYKEELQRYGIMFDDLTTKDLLTAESKDLCQALLGLDELALGTDPSKSLVYMPEAHFVWENATYDTANTSSRFGVSNAPNPFGLTDQNYTFNDEICVGFMSDDLVNSTNIQVKCGLILGIASKVGNQNPLLVELGSYSCASTTKAVIRSVRSRFNETLGSGLDRLQVVSVVNKGYQNVSDMPL